MSSSPNGLRQSEWRVQLGNTALPDMWRDRLIRLQVELGEGLVNEARLTLRDEDGEICYDDRLHPGASLTVCIAEVTLFDGELVGLESRADANQPARITLRAMDRRHRLSLAARSRSLPDTTVAELLHIVATAHALEGRAPSGLTLGHMFMPDSTDLALLNEAARRTGLVLGISGNCLTMERPEDHPAIPWELSPENEPRFTIQPTSAAVGVHGWEPLEKRVIRVGDATQHVEDPVISTTEEAETQARLQRRAAREQSATFSAHLTGSPALRPGHVMTVAPAPPGLAGPWRLTHANHSLGPRGYRTRVEAVRADVDER